MLTFHFLFFYINKWSVLLQHAVCVANKNFFNDSNMCCVQQTCVQWYMHHILAYISMDSLFHKSLQLHKLQIHEISPRIKQTFIHSLFFKKLEGDWSTPPPIYHNKSAPIRNLLWMKRLSRLSVRIKWQVDNDKIIIFWLHSFLKSSCTI